MNDIFPSGEILWDQFWVYECSANIRTILQVGVEAMIPVE